MAPRLSWLVIGAGAIGTYIGGSLILHGQRVVFLEQPWAAHELSQRGLKLNLLGQDYRILHPDIFSSFPDPRSYAGFDIAIFALKSYDTQPVLESLHPFITTFPPVLCLQNGVENEPALQAVLGENRVIAGSVTSSVSRRDPGDICLERLRGVGITAGHPLSSPIVQAFSEAQLNPRLYKNPSAMKWSKMLTNLLANASCAILDLTPSGVLRHPGLYKMEIAQLREAIAVMQALHLRPVDLPGTPVRLFVWMVSHLSPNFSQSIVSRFAGQGRGQKMPSFHIDLYAGRGKSEVDYLNGAVVRFGKQLDIPAPINEWLNYTLLRLTQGTQPLDTYAHNPDKLLRDIYSSTLAAKAIP